MPVIRNRSLNFDLFKDDIAILAPSYVLGESQRHYSSIENYVGNARHYNVEIDRVAPIFNCKYFWESHLSPFDLALASAEKTLALGDVDPATIDMVFFCSNAFIAPYEEILLRDTGAFLARLGCNHAMPLGISLLACTTLISAIETATLYLNTYDHIQRILLVAVDKSASDANRFAGFALFSDGASSLILQKCPKGSARMALSGLGLVASSGVISEPDIDKSEKQKVVTELYRTLFSTLSCPPQQIQKIFTVNIFKPFLNFLTLPSGVSMDKIFYDNIEKNGHCWNSDVIVNMCSHFDEKASPVSGTYLLGSLTFGLGGVAAIEVR